MKSRPSAARPEIWLGASQPAGTLIIVLFVPSKDRNGNDIDHDFWVTSALEILGTLFRGATAYPRARGVWRDDERGGKLRYERPTIITCYADHRAMTVEAQARLRAFLHRMGREANQGEIGIVIGDKYYGVTKYDPS